MCIRDRRGAGSELEAWRQRCGQPYAPGRLTLAIPANASLAVGLLAERSAGAGPVIAYVCGGLQCLPPITVLSELERELASAELAAS